MNKLRRKQINEAKILLVEANNILNEVMMEEDNAFNNLSEGLQCTLRGEQMENNVDELEDAINSIDEAICSIDNIE